MNNALYVGLSRQMTLKRQMDVIANNIANSDTVGFKVESLMLREDDQTAPLKPSSGSALPEKIAFVHDAGVSIDYTQGALKQTGGAFDLGLRGDGFFQVQTPNGNRLTRDGRFSLNAQSQLIDVAGNLLLSNGGQPIRIDPTKAAPSIAHDGTISQDGVIAGKVGAFKVADRAQLGKSEGGLFDPTAAGLTPTADPSTSIQQGMIENSNVDAIQQMTRMIAVSRAYEQVSNMMDQTSNTSDESIQRLGKVN
jgi:flagellar basal-body rod protein FlgF